MKQIQLQESNVSIHKPCSQAPTISVMKHSYLKLHELKAYGYSYTTTKGRNQRKHLELHYTITESEARRQCSWQRKIQRIRKFESRRTQKKSRTPTRHSQKVGKTLTMRLQRSTHPAGAENTFPSQRRASDTRATGLTRISSRIVQSESNELGHNHSRQLANSLHNTTCITQGLAHRKTRR